MKKPEYTLTFAEALVEMFENGKWVRGENFAKGLYMKGDDTGLALLASSEFSWLPEPVILMSGFCRQKYRIITVATKKELAR